MILIPIGHEETAVRRLPWITFGVIGICLLALIASGAASMSSSHDERLAESLAAAYEFWFEHPYLEPDPQFVKLVGMAGGGGAETLELLGEASMRPGESVQSREQEQMDELVADVLAAFHSHPLRRFGLVPGDFSLLGLLAHMFLHAGWIHLLGNMLMLYLAGPYIEDVWGRPLYSSFYLLAGVAAALTFVARNADSSVPMIGASGAIAGVMGAFLVRYWSTRIRFFYMFGILIRGTFSAPAWLMLPLWLVQQMFMAAMIPRTEGQGGVAYWAHIGGFVFGVGGAWLIKKQGIEERFIHSAIEKKTETSVVDNTVVDQAMGLLERGEGERALTMLLERAKSDPSNHDVGLACWEVAVQLGRPKEASPVMLQVVRQALRGEDRSEGPRLWDDLCSHVPDVKVDAVTCVRLAEAMASTGKNDQAAIMLRRATLACSGKLTPNVALQIGQVGKKIDPRIAANAMRVALARPDLSPDDKDRLEAALAALPKPVPVTTS